MDHFEYRDGELHAESTRVAEIASEFGTPCYVYSAATLELHYDRLVSAFAELDPLVCFSVKSCSNIQLLRLLARKGAGMDVVSGGELLRARLAGVPAGKIVYAGVGKTDQEIREALAGGALSHGGRDLSWSVGGGGSGMHGDSGRGEPIGLFNIESEQEYEAIAGAARAMGVQARAALRVNPGVKAGGHQYIETAVESSKFGVEVAHAAAMLRRLGREKHLRLSGVHMHIGSSIVHTEPYVEAVKRVLALIDEVATSGVTIDTLDLGGGFGADYCTGDAPAAAEYAKAIVPLLKERVRAGLKVIFEPGRSIAANAGILLARVLYVKTSGAKKFIITDAGMHTLIRPALYDAFHFVWPASVSPQHEPTRRAAELELPGLERCDVVGPVCESGDFIAKDRLLPPVARGELLAVYTAGAYGMSMASRYNSHPLPAEVLVDGELAALIRKREDYADLVAHEVGLG